MYKVRTATYEELPKVAEMHSAAWGGEYAPMVTAYQKRYLEKPEWRNAILVCEREDGVLLGTTTIKSFNMYVDGTATPMGGIAGVTALPEYRSQGAASALVRYTLQRMREQGMWVSVLAPFRHSYYRRFGWEPCYRLKTYTMPIEVLAPYHNKRDVDVRAMSMDNIDELQRIHDRYCERYTGMVKRDPELWSNIFGFPKKAVYGIYEGERLKGYVALQQMVGGYDGSVETEEIIALDRETERHLLGVLYSFSSTNRTVKLTVPLNDPLLEELDNPRQETRIAVHFSSRVVDVERFVPLLRFDERINACFNLRIVDKDAEWNDKVFRFVIGGGRAAALPCVDVPQAEIAIGAFTQLCMGYSSAEELLYRGALTCGRDVELLLKRAFPTKPGFIIEHF